MSRRVDVEPRREHERALVRARMRQRQHRVAAHLVVTGDQIDVKRTRPPALLAHAAKRSLSRLAVVKYRARGEVAVGEKHGVEVVRLRRTANRNRFEYRGDRAEPQTWRRGQMINTSLQIGQPV